MTSSTSEKPLVELTKGVNGLEKVVLREVRGSSAEVYLYGGQVTSWKNDHREELLFVSSKVLFVVIFLFRLRVALSPAGDLMLTSRIRNTNIDGKPFTFTFAYHTYFSFSDISEVRVEGLETLDYLENKERFTEQGDAITFESEVDKIYLSTPTKIAILDHEKKRTFVIRKDGLPDAVVWNPWDKKAKSMTDFGDEEYKHMLCVEAAAVEKSITLKPGEEWRGRQELSAVPSSYCSGQLDPKKVLLGS
ncbi:putative glucose-6-phosphate 1-epimerase [Capsicum chinense]|nr:putative glucose-6-phosphate 1-epimerase [Capsicum chinense]